MFAPKLSYTFLAFNNWPLLERTLNSARTLKHSQEVEWVVVDNSVAKFRSEMTRNIEDWLDKNELVGRSIHATNMENIGEGGGMNQCFNLARGDYILFFQDDWECMVDYNFIDFGIEVLNKFNHIFMVQLGKRDWNKNKNCMFGRVLLPTQDGMTAVEMGDNGYGNNTSQIRLFKKATWEKVGPYLDMKTIPWTFLKPNVREGSFVEMEYGQRLQKLGFKAAKINDGQFIHTLPENARAEHFIVK
ncbi:MAG: glycosyltransferase family 2 protein [Nitrososphaera sp.]|nr:glycosyltransferase family 2 protein [Nitrososphaera sp.]